MRIRVKNWESFQHYKNRNPPWIRLYRSLLDDYQFHSLSGDDAKFLIMMWLLAASDPTKQGLLPRSETLAFRLRVNVSELPSIIKRLEHWLTVSWQDASMAQAPCYKNATAETEAEADYKHRKYISSKVESVEQKDTVSPQDIDLRSPKRQDNKVESVNNSYKLQSPRANKILSTILGYWPEYQHARETAARLAADPRFANLETKDVLQAAHTAWPPGRDMYTGNGLHGFLSAFFSNAARDAKKEQTRNTGHPGAPQATLGDKLLKFDLCVQRNVLIDISELQMTIAAAIEDRVPIPDRLRSWIQQCASAERPAVELLPSGKIEHISAEIAPCGKILPNDLARGLQEVPRGEDLAELLGKVGKRF